MNGKKCEYLHRLPTAADIYPPSVDCFGRDKFSDYRDDMGGVGSVFRQNRTLYVGHITVTDDIEEIVSRHFKEWGQIERIRVLNDRGIAFITYRYEANAQFAKEAMAHQSLDHEEELNVRWATEDPNPRAQEREQRRLEENAAEFIKRSLPESVVKEIESGEFSKKRKLEGPESVLAIENDIEDEQDEQVQQMALVEPPPKQEEPLTNKKGILSAHALKSLETLKSSTAKKEHNDGSQARAATVLVDYDSDDD